MLRHTLTWRFHKSWNKSNRRYLPYLSKLPFSGFMRVNKKKTTGDLTTSGVARCDWGRRQRVRARIAGMLACPGWHVGSRFRHPQRFIEALKISLPFSHREGSLYRRLNNVRPWPLHVFCFWEQPVKGKAGIGESIGIICHYRTAKGDFY